LSLLNDEKKLQFVSLMIPAMGTPYNMLQRKIFITISFLSIILFLRFLLFNNQQTTYHDGETITFNKLLLSDVDSYRSTVSFTTILPNSLPPQRVRIVSSPNMQLHYGQYLHISGILKQGLLDQKNPVWTISFPKVSHVSWYGSMLFNILYSIRSTIESVYRLTLSDIDSSLLLGIVFGIQGNMPKEFSQDLQKTGVTHVIAASGMNVTLVAGFLIAFFGKLTKKRTAIIFSLFGLLVYALFAGLQASILRATLMGICVFSAQLLGRQYHSLYVLFVVGFIMLVVSPQLLFDIGFQLSFLSTLGIITLQPLIPGKNILSEDIITTISAQITTIPILLINFGQYSLLSVLVNALVLWIIPFLMLLGSFAAFIGLFMPFLAKPILFLSLPMLWYFEAVVSFFASLPILLRLSNISFLLLIGYYFLVLAVILFSYQRRKQA
jgi:competence protein ComEC